MQVGFKRDVLVTVLIQSVATVCSGAFVLLTARWLGAEARGRHASLVAAAQLSCVVIGLGVPSSIPAVIGGDRTKWRTVLAQQLRVLLFASLLSCCAIYVRRKVVDEDPWAGYAPDVAAFAVIALGQGALANMLLALGASIQFNLASLFSAAFPVALLAASERAGILSVPVALRAQWAGLLLSSLYCAFALFRHTLAQPWGRTAAGRVVVGGVWRIAAQGYVSSILAILLFRGDIFLVGALTGRMDAVGAYSIAVFAAEVALKVPQWAASVLSAAVAADAERAAARTIRLFWLSMLASSLLYAAALVARPLIQLHVGRLLGPSFHDVWDVTFAVFPRVIFQSGGAILAANLAGKGYTLWHPGATLGGLVSVALLDLALVPRFGAVGGGVASSLGYFVSLVLVAVGFLHTNGLSVAGFCGQSSEWIRSAWVPNKRERNGSDS